MRAVSASVHGRRQQEVMEGLRFAKAKVQGMFGIVESGSEGAVIISDGDGMEESWLSEAFSSK